MRKSQLYLARRERQILDTLYRVGEADVTGVLENMPDPPSYSCVRSLLRILERKGHVRHKKQGARYVYLPAQSRDKARKTALEHIVKTFFDGSMEHAVAALLDISGVDVRDGRARSNLADGARGPQRREVSPSRVILRKSRPRCRVGRTLVCQPVKAASAR